MCLAWLAAPAAMTDLALFGPWRPSGANSLSGAALYETKPEQAKCWFVGELVSAPARRLDHDVQSFAMCRGQVLEHCLRMRGPNDRR
jgi:hypothetical protein